MSTANPIARSNRRTDVALAADQVLAGPFDWIVFDLLDVEVLRQRAADPDFVVLTGGYTVGAAETDPATGEDVLPGQITVTLDAAEGVATTLLRVQGKRVQERVTNVTRGGVIASVSLENELDRQSIVLQELRRDTDDVKDIGDQVAGNAAAAAQAAEDAETARSATEDLRDDTVQIKSDVEVLKGSVDTAASNAATSATAAQTAASVATNLAASIIGTSTTPQTLSTGLHSGVTQSSKHFEPGNWIIQTSDSDPANRYMHGPVTGYDPVTGAYTFDVKTFGGTGSRSDWTLHISGAGLSAADVATLAQAVSDAQTARDAAITAKTDAQAANTSAAAHDVSAAAHDTAAAGSAAAAAGYAALLGSPDYGFFSDAPTSTRDYGTFP